jgi:hypothetical protein
MDTVTNDQWLVIGMLLVLVLAELVVHPAVSASLLSFLSHFKPGDTSVQPANTSNITSNGNTGVKPSLVPTPH